MFVVRAWGGGELREQECWMGWGSLVAGLSGSGLMGALRGGQVLALLVSALLVIVVSVAREVVSLLALFFSILNKQFTLSGLNLRSSQGRRAAISLHSGLSLVVSMGSTVARWGRRRAEGSTGISTLLRKTMVQMLFRCQMGRKRSPLTPMCVARLAERSIVSVWVNLILAAAQAIESGSAVKAAKVVSGPWNVYLHQRSTLWWV